MRAAPLAGSEDRPASQPGAGRGLTREITPELSLLAQRTRPAFLAREELLPLASPLAELLGTPGLRRGTTLVVEAARTATDRGAASGATSLALALLAAASAEGAWSGIVGLPDLGLLAAEQLGVDLTRVVVVPDPKGRSATTIAAFLEGFDLVLARLPAGLPAATARQLSARARERRCVMIIAGAGVAETLPASTGRLTWPEAPEARLSVQAAAWERPSGAGLFSSRRIEVMATRRRAAPEVVHGHVLLPAARSDEHEPVVRLAATEALALEPVATVR